jgi:hypothetical protein
VIYLFLITMSNHSNVVQEYEDVQLTAFLSSLTKSANILNDVCPVSYPDDAVK